MSRRSMLVQAVRRNSKKKAGPHIVIMPEWTWRDGEPRVTWTLDQRAPTEQEIATAVSKWKRDRERERERAKHLNNVAAHQGATKETEA